MKYRYDKKLGKVVEKTEPPKEVSILTLTPPPVGVQWMEMWAKPFEYWGNYELSGGDN